MDEQTKLLRKINRRTRFTQFLAWLALFFTAVAIAAGSKHWLRSHEKAKLALRQIKEIRQEMPNYASEEKLAKLEKEINDNFKDNKTHLDKAMNQLRTIQDSTQHIADSVYVQAETLTKQQPDVRIQTPTLKDWSLGEVHFLLQTAVQQFEIKKDKESAIVSFKLADNLLLERGELNLLPVRKKISEDIATVNQFTTVDTSQLSTKIDALLRQLKPIFKKSESKSEDIELLTIDEIDKESQVENTLVDKVKKTINDAVVIRKLDQSLQQDLDVDSKERLYQLFALRFETLRIMLLQADDKSYHKQIENIKSLIFNYYPEEQQKLFLDKLEVLDRVNLSPAFPNVKQSLKLLQEIMSEKDIIEQSDSK